jgi:hypothetical protein
MKTVERKITRVCSELPRPSYMKIHHGQTRSDLPYESLLFPSVPVCERAKGRLHGLKASLRHFVGDEKSARTDRPIRAEAHLQ